MMSWCGVVCEGRPGKVPAIFGFLAVSVLLCGAAVLNPVSKSTLTNDPFCAAPAGSGRQGTGTLKMIARLQQVLQTPETLSSPFLSDLIAQRLAGAIASSTNPGQQLSLQIQYAIESMKAGRSLDALREFERIAASMNEKQLRLAPGSEMVLQVQRAMTFLRLGEQENCVLNHTAESCLIPIQPGGVHRLQRGSRAAIEAFTELLKQRPDEPGLRWLLNIAYMTVGEYPHKVPVQWLIPESVFASAYPMPRFPEAAAAAGLDLDDLAGGCIAEDFDGDGLLDVMVSSWRLHGQLRFFHNGGDGSFIERTREAGLTGLVGGLNIMQTDYNNDGHADVFVLRGAWLGRAGRHPNSLLRNNGDGTFEDVTEEAKLLSYHPTQTATWLDFDGDGWIDLFIGNESYGTEQHPCELYRNNRNGTFTEVAQLCGVAQQRFVKGVTSGDYDDDGRPDLFLSCRDGRPNVLLHNNGPSSVFSRTNFVWHFSDVSAQAGFTEPDRTFPTWFFDYDNDGRLDLFVAGYSATVAEIAADYLGQNRGGERVRLYRNEGDGTFRNLAKRTGLHKIMLGMGANYGDFDNDGWLDFYIGTGDPDYTTLIPNRAFRNDGGTNFQEVTTAAGMGHLQKGHGIAFADFDHDGQQDIYAVMGGAYPGDNYRNALFVNPGNTNHWITLKLAGVKSNRAAIGARIRVLVKTTAGTRSIYKTVSSGGSFGASPLRQEIGLGSAQAIEAVEIFWPVTGRTQKLTGLAMDRIYRVQENAPQAELWELPRFKLATHGKPHSAAPPHRHAESISN